MGFFFRINCRQSWATPTIWPCSLQLSEFLVLSLWQQFMWRFIVFFFCSSADTEDTAHRDAAALTVNSLSPLCQHRKEALLASRTAFYSESLGLTLWTMTSQHIKSFVRAWTIFNSVNFFFFGLFVCLQYIKKMHISPLMCLQDVFLQLWGLLGASSRDSSGQVRGPLHFNVSHSKSESLLRSAQVLFVFISQQSFKRMPRYFLLWRSVMLISTFKALSGHQWWATFPKWYIQCTHLPWAGQGARGQPHSPDVSQYTQVRYYKQAYMCCFLQGCKTRLDERRVFFCKNSSQENFSIFYWRCYSQQQICTFFPMSKNRFSPFKHSTFCKIISLCADSGVKWSTQAAATTMGSELRNRSSTSHLCSRRRCAYDICEPGWGRMWRDSNTGECFSPSTLM